MDHIPENTRSKDFRYIYANGLGLQFNGIELMLIFGIKEDYSKNDDVLMEEARVILSPSGAKLLGLMLNGVVEAAEKTTGQLIPVDVEKLESLKKQFEQVSNSPASSPPLFGQSLPGVRGS